MSWLIRAKHLLRRLRNPRKTDADLEAEVQSYFVMMIERRISQGMTQEDAARATRLDYDNSEQVKEKVRDVRVGATLETVIQDLRYASRALRKQPGFTAGAVITLALGLGINTAVFSLVNAVILRPLPYAEPGQLISLYEEKTRQGPANMSSSGARLGGAADPARTEVSVANLPDYRRASAFAGLAHCELTSKTLTGLDTPEQIDGESISANFFDVLHVEPERGRAFLPEDERPGAVPVIMVTHYFWQRRLGGDTNVLKRFIMLDGQSYQVVGVVPPTFQSPFQLTLPSRMEFYTPALFPAGALTSRENHQINVVGRLNATFSIHSAQAELDVIAAGL